jgi:DNA-binding NarL/FixJ family response regulator
VDVLRQRYRTRKFNINQERSLNGSAEQQALCKEDPRPTPSQLALAEDQWEQLLKDQPPHYRLILTLLRQGDTHAEIARKVGVSERTVRRLVRKLDPGSAL